MPWIDHDSAIALSATRMSRQVVGGEEILLCWAEGVPYAYRNQCTHLAKPLDEGRLIAGQIHCPFHGACFDVRSGAAVRGPAVAPLQRVAVKIENGRMLFDTTTAPCDDLPALIFRR
ncbi:Rieske (2Fe-2S) protein [Pseudomonas sp. SB113]|uniref:Rieske (2Fe-2S) protein n=1 Tax=Pseudomonas sp. SB113 TaxID=3154123 RepID=UPI00345DB179